MKKEEFESLVDIDGEHCSVSLVSQVERKKYIEINEILERLGGKWNKKAKAHIFQINPEPLINAYLETGILPEKNPTAFFPTPPILSNDILELSGFSENYFEDGMRKMKVLEPSGGVGGLADAIMETSSGYVDLDIVEILDINQRLLREKGYEPICMDFMEYNKDYKVKYDYVIMNPPFSLKGDNKAYITHVNHAFNMLNEIGVLSAIIPKGFMRNTTKKEKEFLELVTQCGSIYKNPKGSFKESGTMVETYTIVLHKSNLKWRSEVYQGYKNYHTWYGVLIFNNSRDYANRYIKKAELDSFLDDALEVTKEAVMDMIIEENREENLISVDNIDYIAESLIKEAMEHRKYMGLDCEIKESTTTVVEITKPIKPSNNALYDENQLEVFATGSLF